MTSRWPIASSPPTIEGISLVGITELAYRAAAEAVAQLVDGAGS